jgi:hypothetical protein
MNQDLKVAESLVEWYKGQGCGKSVFALFAITKAAPLWMTRLR